MHRYARMAYKLTKNFPKEELYGITSQLRRAALSVVLNYIEGYARFKTGTKLQFFEIAYGSLKESKYLIYFSYEEDFITKDEYENCFQLAEEIGKMLWREIESLQQ